VSRTVEQKGITFTIEGDARKIIQATDKQLAEAMKVIGLAWHGRSVRYLAQNIYNRRIPLNKSRRRKWIRTNRLRSSMTFENDAKSVTLGTNVEYAPVVHEGLNEAVQSVRAHTRNMPARSFVVKSLFGRQLDKPLRIRIPKQTQQVRSHTRTVSRKAVPFISQPGYDLLPNIPRLIVGELNE
jgi:phage gpG-like protein